MDNVPNPRPFVQAGGYEPWEPDDLDATWESDYAAWVAGMEQLGEQEGKVPA